MLLDVSNRHTHSLTTLHFSLALRTRRSTKLHTLTVKENEIALNIVDTDNGSNGKGIELKAIETRTALDEGLSFLVI